MLLETIKIEYSVVLYARIYVGYNLITVFRYNIGDRNRVRGHEYSVSSGSGKNHLVIKIKNAQLGTILYVYRYI